MDPLDSYTEQIKKKFPKHIPLEETEINIFNKAGALFKQENYNTYCFLEPVECGIAVSFFKCDWKPFEKIEDEYLDYSICFCFVTQEELGKILEHLK